MLKSQISLQFILVVLLAVFMSACGSRPAPAPVDHGPVQVSLAKVEQGSAQYLAQAEQSSGESRIRLRLLAAHALLNEGNEQAAGQLLAKLKANLSTAELLAEHSALSARLLEQQGRFDEALTKLVLPAGVAKWQKANFHQLRAQLFHKTQQPMLEAQELSALGQYLSQEQAIQAHDALWQILAAQTEAQLQQADNSQPQFSGWLQLAYLAKHYAVSPNELVRNLGDWQRANPSHPAALRLPGDLQKALNTKPYKPQKIAVLLPLSGPAANAANAIRNGIVSSYLAQNDGQVSISFFDSATDPVAALTQAQAEGAEFIIGPLLQSEIEKLLQPGISAGIPQLFLNKAERFSPENDRFFFSLSPAEEASDAAEHLFKDGIAHPLLLVSNDATGRRMAEAFNHTWQQLTQDRAEVHFYDGGDKMKLTVQQALGVSDSQERIARIKELLGSKIKADFRSRQDIDAIYMISAPQDIALLKPFIDVSFSVFAEPVPMYVSSRARNQDNTAAVPPEFNNLIVSDIPWLMQLGAENREINGLWPDWNNSQKRLFIMGYDAFELVGRLAQMRAFPGFQYQGRGGKLSVGADGVIKRQLSWGKYQRGALRPL
ncbi:penicillin-binding protein activator [Shewanella cyperi]|uniref:penicillin-binding protein activator n=1 Tax=Shewanella cyperi TaxID=2814292 RepID=UPI001A954276|nr:penicillin-binding protein activator [Shewanella cyperi]QSX40630.1 penicillin-binding protein activator [Shewanella cyperi]